MTDANGFKKLQADAEKKTDALVQEATATQRADGRKLVTVFDELSDTLCKVADMVRV